MIYLGADHRGFKLKEKAKQWLAELGYEFEDCGAAEYNTADDNPLFAEVVARKVVATTYSRGILFCGSGVEIAIAANKIDGVRAGTITDPQQAAAAVHDEDLNILALPTDFVSVDQAKEIIKFFLEAKFGGDERYLRRLEEIKELEKNN